MRPRIGCAVFRRAMMVATVLVALVTTGCSVIDAFDGPEVRDYFSPAAVELLAAARDADLDSLERAVADGADLDARADGHDPRRAGITLLQWAVEFERPATIRTLLEAGADPLLGPDNYNAVSYAILRDRVPSLEVLIEADPSLVEAPDRLGGNVVHTAVRYSRDDALRLLVDRGADLDSVSTTARDTPLFTAAAVRNVDHCLLLLRAGADGGHRDAFGKTFLAGLYRADDSVSSRSFLRTRAAIEKEMRERGFPVETGR